MRRDAERVQLVQMGGKSVVAAFHDAGGTSTVIFCHGFRGEKTGPNRTFVRAARGLADHGISSIRFDQPGSGDSAGDFASSSFNEWVETCRLLAASVLDEGRRVALFGQSMGGAAALCAAVQLPQLSAVVAWMPDPNVDPFSPDPAGFMEEGGQRVQNRYWEEAHQADVPGCLARLSMPVHLVFGTEDAYVSAENRQALVERTKQADVVDILDGHSHSAWTYDQAQHIIRRSTEFLMTRLRHVELR